MASVRVGSPGVARGDPNGGWRYLVWEGSARVIDVAIDRDSPGADAAGAGMKKRAQEITDCLDGPDVTTQSEPNAARRPIRFRFG